MINDDNDDEKYYYFAVKSSGDNWFENALNDALDYQSIKKDPQKIPKLKPYINQYNWKDLNRKDLIRKLP